VTDPTRRANHLRDFVPADLSRANKQVRKSLRQSANFASDFNAPLAVQIAREKYSAFVFGKTCLS
jgi:hypothetical protein